jgi:hypothetical protein
MPGGRRCGTLLTNVVHSGIACRFHLGGVLSLGLAIGLSLFSSPAAAQVYPVSGVWVAVDPQFPAAAGETCIAVKAFGVEAVINRSVLEMIIFARDKRYDVKADAQIETTIKSVKMAHGGFRITESPSKRGWLGFRKKATYVLKVIDPAMIEIWDAAGMTRYTKCGSQRPPIFY